VGSDLLVTEKDLHDAHEFSKNLSLEDVRDLMIKVLKIHELDPNFSPVVLDKIHLFLDNPNVMENPEKHADLIREIKVEAALMSVCLTLLPTSS